MGGMCGCGWVGVGGGCVVCVCGGEYVCMWGVDV